MKPAEQPVTAWRMSCIRDIFPTSGKRSLLLTGSKGAGKTSLCEALLEHRALPGVRSRLCRDEAGQPHHVLLEARTGPGRVILGRRAGERMAPDLPALEQAAALLAAAAAAPGDWAVVDEVGYLEQASGVYQARLRELFDKKRVLAVLRKADTPLLAELRRRPDCLLVDLDELTPPRVGAVVLAAGKGERFGGNKLLAELGGVPLLARTLAALPRDRLARVTAVVSAPEVAALCERSGVPCLVNPGGPQSESVRRGLAAMADLDGCLFWPGDQPLCRQASAAALVESFWRFPQAVARLAWQGKPGSPVVFPASLFPRLAALTGDVGGMAAVPGSGAAVRLVPAGQPWELWDADTPDALARLEACLAAEQ